MTLEFKIKQDGLIVARGEGDVKEWVLSEACHYFTMYQDEEFENMTMEIRKKKDNMRTKKG